MDDLLNEFLTETAESIDVVDIELVKLEQDPNNKEVLDNIFRLVHTIKGTCGFLGLPRLESVAHASENVLGKFRDGELEVSEHSVTVILESLDRIKEILAGLEATEEEPDGDDSDLINRLDAIAEGADAEPVEDEPDTVDGEIVDTTLGRALKPGEVSLEELEAAFANAPGPEDTADDTAPEPEAAAPASSGGSLYDRVGGEDSVAVAAHLVATRIANDDQLKKFFEAVAIDLRKSKFLGLMMALFKDDIDAADTIGRQLVTVTGFGDGHFDKMLKLVKEALVECQVSSDDADEAVMTFELIREAVVNASKEVAKSTPNKAGTEQKTGPAAGAAGPAKETKKVSQSIRVNVELLEDLMNMVSELVLTRNQLLQITRNLDNTELAVPLQRLSQCTTELQENVMKTRMQPIGNAWAKLPRIVRDLTVELDKKIELEMIGADTELDRQVLELIKDPLTHMVRNSADHGIETPAVRMANGKPEQGTITLNAFHEGGHIIIEIKDDGAGIPVAKLAKKILEKGLATEAELAEMSDNQIQKFIFHPGFSTAEQVTSVSGRGVGMDVVRSNIEKIGGTIDMTSVEGKGTTFDIKIPLTLAIVAGLIVKAQEERYAIPQISVLELVRASANSSNNSEHKIETINNAPVLRLRNRLLPLVYLNEVLGFMTREEIDAREEADDFIVVTQVGPFTFGIVVDQVFDTEEIVVKPVAPILKDLDIYSGNTILGDGSVIMILDPNGVASLANNGVQDQQQDADGEQEAVQRAKYDETESMLVFTAGGGNPKAVPLALIARLEEIDTADVEISDGRHMVQYRGNLMPLIKANPDMELLEEGRQPVLVFTDREYTMGLAVDEIKDIVEEKLDVKLASNQAGVVGSAVIAGKASEVIDVSYYLNLAFSDWMRSGEMVEEGLDNRGLQLLLVDDSDFFRNMVKPVLTVAGYSVATVSSAAGALQMMEDGQMFDLIISDIEMPDMNGYEFVAAAKADDRWANTPIVALSSLAKEKDINRGYEAGFDDYVAKFDKDTLLRSLAQQLKIKGDAA
ncbi:hybrid sensor histidine kinase/response regulator [Kordiimonas laminariae]|uniref:hybrid sensor histidine kinase/response regulator n=1 Tax=Kordiimonas laminariae TaxID=2917717 RepID=UPI001FF64EA6|nr:hybrid sensor histidine kinase/response regulator [Kordiimonas laminariae]MCK0068745.1 hybrid sensor histidine kinase/response regulator [Kordiimonas laminariae]